MTAVLWVRRAQWRLALLAAVRAVAWAGAILLVGLTLRTLAGVPSLREIVLLAGLGTLAALGWHERFVWSRGCVALWLEERLPELRYALITAMDPRHAVVLAPRVEPVLARVDATRALRQATLRSAMLPVFALGLAAIAFATASERVPAADRIMSGAIPGGDERPSRLEPLRAVVTPPRYALTAGVDARTVNEPTTIAALAGSTVEILGPGSADGLGVQLGDSVLAASTSGDEWRVTFTLPDSAAALRLEDRTYRRLIVLAPARDRPPTVQLILPARDTTVREATGALTLDARLTDDVAISAARFEYIVASGESEGSFTFREGVLGAKRMGATVRDTRQRITIQLHNLELKPGDQLTVRAAAIDNNAWSGPATGYSEARTLRVARPGEYDSLAVEPAPPPADSMLMTLRWLIQRVERLDASREVLPRPMFVDSSRGFGTRAERIRSRVQQLQGDQTSGGMFPPNPLLATAYLALVQGENALKVAEPRESLPHLWDALRALQEFAWAERYYLRGRGADVLVDLARVRLTGADTGRASSRSPRGLADTARVRMRRSYTAALALLTAAPDSARERLALIQVGALRGEPALAQALGSAIAAMHAGRDPAAALQRARRILEGPAVTSDTLPGWSGAW